MTQRQSQTWPKYDVTQHRSQTWPKYDVLALWSLRLRAGTSGGKKSSEESRCDICLSESHENVWLRDDSDSLFSIDWSCTHTHTYNTMWLRDDSDSLFSIDWSCTHTHIQHNVVERWLRLTVLYWLKLHTHTHTYNTMWLRDDSNSLFSIDLSCTHTYNTMWLRDDSDSVQPHMW